MKIAKSTFLPIMGMFVLAVFNLISYVQESPLLDKILVCSFILSVVFIVRIRESINQQIPNGENQ